MKAVAITGFAAAGDAIEIVDMPAPEPAAGEVRIAVSAAGINPADWKLAEGWPSAGFTPHFPYALGFDAAGVIEGIDSDVKGLAIGMRVVAKTTVGRGGAGALAGFVTVPAHLVCPLPDALDLIDAAALPTAGITAWEALFDCGALKPGQSILINGGAGGTGSYAIGLARMAGARVFATASAGNLDYLGMLGADLALDYRIDWQARLPGPIDLLLDTVGQGVIADPLPLIRDGGALVTIGTLVQNEPRPPAGRAAARAIRVLTAMSNRNRESGQLRALVTALAERRLQSPAIEVIAPHHVGDALRRLKAGHVRGKIVVKMAKI